MKNVQSLFLLVIFSLSITVAQDIHSPAEILKILENSDVSYELSILENNIPSPDRSSNLNYNSYYREYTDSGSFVSKKYTPNEKAAEYMDLAEQLFGLKKYDEAMGMYKRVLEFDSAQFKVMTYIGQIYGIEGKYDSSIYWYRQAISHNYIDYMAHWFLANMYRESGEIDKAVDEITIAHILNRNNPRIKKSMSIIYDKKKLNADDWYFNPQYTLDSIGTKDVRISFNGDWLGYAMAKAVWKYEPGYPEKMGVTNSFFSTFQEKECLAGLINVLDKKRMKKYPEFKAFNLALENKFIEEYILYEILLPEVPFAAYQFPENLMESIKNYVITVRGEM